MLRASKIRLMRDCYLRVAMEGLASDIQYKLEETEQGGTASDIYQQSGGSACDSGIPAIPDQGTQDQGTLWMWPSNAATTNVAGACSQAPARLSVQKHAINRSDES